HFVAMLAYREMLPTYYEPATTLLSLLIAITVASFGFALASNSGRRGSALLGSVLGTSRRLAALPGAAGPPHPRSRDLGFFFRRPVAGFWACAFSGGAP